MTTDAISPAPEALPVQKLTYSVDESAAALGVSRATIYRLIARRVLRPIPELRHKRIPIRQVESIVQHASRS